MLRKWLSVYDCIDAEGRATQELVAENNYQLLNTNKGISMIFPYFGLFS